MAEQPTTALKVAIDMPRSFWNSRAKPTWARSAPLLLTLATLQIGCNDGRPARVPVSGQVLIDGQPLTHGHVQFVPQGTRASAGVLDKEGRFTLRCFDKSDGAVRGSHTVVISGAEPLGSTKTIWHAPKKYASASTSGVTQEINGPTPDVVIKISWEGGQPFVEDGNTGAIDMYKPSKHRSEN